MESPVNWEAPIKVNVRMFDEILFGKKIEKILNKFVL
jgi:hypothetical protein